MFFLASFIQKAYDLMLMYFIGFYSLAIQLGKRLFTNQGNREFRISRNVNKQSILITGGGAGIGLVVAEELAAAGAHVIIAGPCLDVLLKAADSIKDKYQRNLSIDCMELDLSSLQSVRSFFEDFSLKYKMLRILINNAGVMLIDRATTINGFDYQWQVNYLGHFLLTYLLLPHLVDASRMTGQKSRIICLTSSTHLIGDINFDNLCNEIYFSSHASYPQSKLAVVCMTLWLNKTFRESGLSQHITINCLHPGVILSNLYQHLHPVIRGPLRLLAKFCFNSVRDGAHSVLHLATDPNLDNISGRYFDGFDISQPSYKSQSQQLQHRLWMWTCCKLKLDPLLSKIIQEVK